MNECLFPMKWFKYIRMNTNINTNTNTNINTNIIIR